jgi:shikimate kinase
MSETLINQKNIILIGFMGCGKSTVGRELKRLLGYKLIDTDVEIENRAKKKIIDIFAENGEEDFRDRETAYLHELIEKKKTERIISTGGGIILREENRELIQKLGYVIWLRIDAKTSYERTKRSRSRPILRTENPQQVIEKLILQRTPFYKECANLTIDVNELDRSEIAMGITESARYFFSQE